MRRRPRPTLAVLAILSAAAPAAALTRRELACQAAIARAGRGYVARELAQRARCWIAAVQGQPCADEEKVAERNQKHVRHLLRRCRGVTLARLGGGGCVAQSANADALADCVVETHADAVSALLSAQFGFELTPSAATPCGPPQPTRNDDHR